MYVCMYACMYVYRESVSNVCMRSNPEPENLKRLQGKKKHTHSHSHSHTQEGKVGLQKLITYLGVCGIGFPLRNGLFVEIRFHSKKT
jgi:hypothetical protein